MCVSDHGGCTYVCLLTCGCWSCPFQLKIAKSRVRLRGTLRNSDLPCDRPWPMACGLLLSRFLGVDATEPVLSRDRDERSHDKQDDLRVGRGPPGGHHGDGGTLAGDL